MIGSLRGTVLDRTADGEVLVECGRVGYRVTVPAAAMAAVGDLGDQTFLHVHTHVREDALVLYGFPTREERHCFELLLGAHGVGPALALAILSVHGPNALRRAVITDDVDALTLVPGVGRKTAQRLLIELKSRFDVDDDFPSASNRGSGEVIDPLVEVRTALSGLGYGPDEVRAAVAGLPEGGSVEDLLRTALRALAVAR